ncbi:hypothetical protein HJC23_001802 [Cyclotella cryptica]|uniref:Small ribosomal subunit protein mS35 mitochondrial conserved domain-containing protein n=1 Tax=Cyclotella cryptica TaxID=29204 RepID=A0ABD3PH06_9STRA|eukprot:CCRYP_014496-RA/>CCRYP_014496-RA protein AED:0.28 eAED:0.28 QI:0/-1/0/1/-1/1/1/0/246
MAPVRATLSRGRLVPSICSALDVSSRSLHMSMECTKALRSDPRPILSARNYHVPKSNNKSITAKKIPASTTYSALRNKVSMPFERQDGKDYISPYSDFFASIEAGRTSLGTTEEMERQVLEMKEQYLDCGIPEIALRFRTTSYGRFALPPYVSPGEHRVIVTVPLSAIPFGCPLERDILLQIVGSRYNEARDELQLSSEKFASRIENKRHLVGMIEQIVSNSRRLAKEFQDEEITESKGNTKIDEK